MTWRLRKWFWARWFAFRFAVSKPQTIGAPEHESSPVELAPMSTAHPKIPIDEILVYKDLPKDEASIGMRTLVAVGLVLERVIGQMQRNSPEIDADASVALDDALSKSYRKAFRLPGRPSSFDGEDSPGLGSLAVRGPYALLLTNTAERELVWDLTFLSDFAHHPDLRKLGCCVTFTETAGRLTATRIDSDEYGVVSARDSGWLDSKRLATCAATTHTALTRHFNYVHLISGNHWDVSARNHLPTDHPIFRLLWPHIFNSLYTNHGVTRVQLLPDGDFVNMFSFTHAGLMDYFASMHQIYDIRMSNPDADWMRRGLHSSTFDAPTQGNLRDLHGVMVAHARRYIELYYQSDDALREDRVVGQWLAGLDQLIPNGLHLSDFAALTRDALAVAIASFMYDGNTIHDLTGTTLWDYQLWTDQNPTRIHRDGRRIAVDAYQRVINNNFALQLRRAPLLADYGAVALDDASRAAFTTFFGDCSALQQRYNPDSKASYPWRMEPKNLEINMNG